MNIPKLLCNAVVMLLFYLQLSILYAAEFDGKPVGGSDTESFQRIDVMPAKNNIISHLENESLADRNSGDERSISKELKHGSL